MSVDAVRALRDLWRNDTALTTSLNEAFEKIGFSAQYVERQIAISQLQKSRKYIKDNVWGMIEVDASVIRLLDCPVVQRLRSIHQTGLSYLTYPSAEHTRFIHSLGMASVVSSFLEAIDRRATVEETSENGSRFVRSDKLYDLQRDELIHAAILHDVGHMPFSHATEKALQQDIEAFRCGGLELGAFAAEVETTLPKDVSLSEALSLLVVLSERFESFYRQAVRREGADEESVLRIASLIAGLPPEPRLTGVAEIISSAAVDADKIDYVKRDALACGIPVGIDVSRIFLQSGLLVLDEDSQRSLDRPPLKDEVIFVVNASGTDTLDEISQARANLYQRVYLHPVTRTAEAILTEALVANARSSSQDPALVDAITLWAESDDSVLNRLCASKDGEVSELGLRLRNRHMPKKACVFSAQIAETMMPLKEIFREPRHQSALKVLAKAISNPELERLSSHEIGNAGSDIEAAIVVEAQAICQWLKDRGKAGLVPGAALKSVFVVPHAYMDKTRKDAIVLQNGDLVRSSDLSNTHGQQDAGDIFKSVGFVMAEEEWRPLVMVASRVVLARSPFSPIETDLFDPSMRPQYNKRLILDHAKVARRAGVPKTKLNEVVAALTSTGYFDDKPFLAPLVDEGSADVGKIAQKLQPFDGEMSWRVSRRSIAAFVSQFPPKHRQPLMKCLSDFVYLGTDELAASVEGLLKPLPVGVVLPLSPSSGPGVFSGVKAKATLKGHEFCTEIRDALKEGDTRPLYFVDDNVSSATQARAQFLAWIGVPEKDWPEECRGETGIWPKALSADELEKLRSREISVVVAAGREAGKRRLETLLKDQGFKFGSLHYKRDLEGLSWPTDLRAYLTEVGRSLICRTKFGCAYSQATKEQKAFADSNAFGYDGVGALVSTNKSVPTSTVTALWCPGEHNGSPWMPLLLRYGRFNKLIFG